MPKISDLPSTLILTDSDVIPVVDTETATTKKITVSGIADYVIDQINFPDSPDAEDPLTFLLPLIRTTDTISVAPASVTASGVVTVGTQTFGGHKTFDSLITVSASGIQFSNGSFQTVAAAGASPGGSNTQVQFNDSSAFGGDPGLTYDKTTDTLNVGTLLNVGGTSPQTDVTIYSRSTGSSTGTFKGRVIGSGDNVAVGIGEFNSQSWINGFNSNLDAFGNLYISAGGNVTTYIGDSSNDGTANASVVTIVNSTKFVGINNSSPGVVLDIFGVPTTDSANRFLIGLADTTSFGIGVGAGLAFGGKYDSGGNLAGWAGIKGIKENSSDGNYAGALVFVTRPNSGNNTEWARITSNGQFGLGTDTPASGTKLHIVESGSSSGTWRGRIIASGPAAAFLMGEYNGQAWLGAHNAALNAWSDFYINPDGDKKVFIGDSSNNGSADAPILTVNNATGKAGFNTSSPDRLLDVNGVTNARSDIVVDDTTKGIVLKSPDAHYWRITVDNLGLLTTTDLGTTKPS